MTLRTCWGGVRSAGSGVLCPLIEFQWEVIADWMGGIGYDRPHMFRLGVPRDVSLTESLWVGLSQLDMTDATLRR